jgi:hypothetical protein
MILVWYPAPAIARIRDREDGFAFSNPARKRGRNRLQQEGHKACGHERDGPDQVEVEPRLTEKREA